MKRVRYGDTSSGIIRGPLGYREPGGKIEGYVDSPWDVIKQFEPIDVLNGALELVGASDQIIHIFTNNMADIERNEYSDLHELWLQIEDV